MKKSAIFIMFFIVLVFEVGIRSVNAEDTSHGTVVFSEGSQGKRLSELTHEINQLVTADYMPFNELEAFVAKYRSRVKKVEDYVGTYDVIVDDLTFEDAQQMSRLVFWGSNITSEVFSTSSSARVGKKKVPISLFYFPPEESRFLSIENAIRNVENQGCSQATSDEIIFLSQQFPEIPRYFMVMALATISLANRDNPNYTTKWVSEVTNGFSANDLVDFRLRGLFSGQPATHGVVPDNTLIAAVCE